MKYNRKLYISILFVLLVLVVSFIFVNSYGDGDKDDVKEPFRRKKPSWFQNLRKKIFLRHLKTQCKGGNTYSCCKYRVMKNIKKRNNLTPEEQFDDCKKKMSHCLKHEKKADCIDYAINQ